MTRLEERGRLSRSKEGGGSRGGETSEVRRRVREAHLHLSCGFCNLFRFLPIHPLVEQPRPCDPPLPVLPPSHPPSALSPQGAAGACDELCRVEIVHRDLTEAVTNLNPTRRVRGRETGKEGRSQLACFVRRLAWAFLRRASLECGLRSLASCAGHVTPHFTSPRLASPHFAVHPLTFTSPHLTSPYLALPRLTSPHPGTYHSPLPSLPPSLSNLPPSLSLPPFPPSSIPPSLPFPAGAPSLGSPHALLSSPPAQRRVPPLRRGPTPPRPP